MTQASFLLLLLLLWSHSSCKHQNYQRSTCASCPRRRMKSLWRWAWKGNGRHSEILCASVFTFRNIPSLLLRLHFLFCGRGRLMRVPGQWCNFCQIWWKNMICFFFLQKGTEKPYCACGHPQPCDETLPLFYLPLYKTKMFRLPNRFEFSFLFFFLVRRKWEENYQKVTQRPLPRNWAGSCSHQRPSVTLRLSSIRLTDTQISSSALPPSRSVERHHPRAWHQTNLPGHLGTKFMKANAEMVLIDSFRFRHFGMYHLKWLFCFTCCRKCCKK